MQDKPQTIQARPGFAAAIADAANRLLAGNATEKQQLIAIDAKFKALHRAAVDGDEKADQELVEFANERKGDERPAVASEVGFILAERKALEAVKLAGDKLETALNELKQYLAERKEKLTARHHRMASAIVEAINQFPDDDVREKWFQEFGRLLANTQDKKLALYAARLAASPEAAVNEWIGKPIELTGATALGTDFDWTTYRGKVVIIDIWATWCGPCRVEMPKLRTLHEKLSPRGFEVVGVSVDKDAEALTKFLEENVLPWPTLAGDDAMAFAKRLGVRGIPTMVLVDADGRVVAIAHTVADLSEKAESLLAKKG